MGSAAIRLGHMSRGHSEAPPWAMGQVSLEQSREVGLEGEIKASLEHGKWKAVKLEEGSKGSGDKDPAVRPEEEGTRQAKEENLDGWTIQWRRCAL